MSVQKLSYIHKYQDYLLHKEQFHTLDLEQLINDHFHTVFMHTLLIARNKNSSYNDSDILDL